MTIPSFEPMSEEAFQEAASKLPDPIQCLRCGRWLYSKGSIVRGYGQTCAFLAALEELSHGPRSPDKPFRIKPTAEFVRISDTLYEIVDHRDLAIGELRRDPRTVGSWRIWLWGHHLDLDADLESAKVRTTRILDRMGR